MKTISDIDFAEGGDVLPSGSSGPVGSFSAAGFMRRIGASVPPAWAPLGRRALSGTAARLPPGLRYRLHRMIGLMRPDMGEIERDYPSWIVLHDRIDAEGRRGIVAQIARMPHTPLISVVMPVFNPTPAHLSAAVNSVRDQLYPWWELCICDDASTDPLVIAILREAAERDHRIKLVRREQNGHISAASNAALSLATGLVVALLDHDDVLPPHALHEVASTIVAKPDVDIIYSDEDHIDNEGRRSHPYFKPDWNPELILGQNMISHLGVYRRTLVEQIGGFRTGFEGSQDYDLTLRAVGETRGDRIAHIPKVLYHWRQNVMNRTFSEASRDHCVQNGRRAIQEYVARDRADAMVEPAPVVPIWTRVVYPIPAPAPPVSVILSADGSAGALSACINELLTQTDYPLLEILVPADDDGSVQLSDTVAQRERVRFIGYGHSQRTNTAAEQARGSLLLMLNPRLRPNDAGWLREMVSHAVRPGVGVVGAKLLCAEGMVLHAGIVLGGPDMAFMPFVGRQHLQAGYFGYLQLARDVTAVSGKCMMVHRPAFLAMGGRDDGLSSAVLGDVDLCLKFSVAGYRSVWIPSELILRDGAPWQCSLVTDVPADAVRMRQRWGHRLNADPYWNLNLSCASAEVGLAFPPRTVHSTAPTRISADATRQFGPLSSRAVSQTGAT